MKSASAGLISHLTAGQQFARAELWTFTLAGGPALRYTTLDVDVKIGATVWSANGPVLKRPASRLVAGGEVNKFDVSIETGPNDLLQGLPWPQAARRGALRGADLLIERLYFPMNAGALYAPGTPDDGAAVGLAYDFTKASAAPIVGSATLTVIAAGPRTRINPQGLIEVVAAHTPRFDYDPLTRECKGLLIEGARANQVANSGAMHNWTVGNATVVANAAIAPDGTMSATKLNQDAAVGAQHNLSLSVIAGTANVQQTWSVFLKQGEKSWGAVRGAWGSDAQAWFNLANGTIGTVANCTAAIKPAPNGYYRCSITFTPTANFGPIVFVASADNMITENGTAGAGIYVWGGQPEPGDSATSYIPTTSAAVTRNADDISVPVGNWYNVTEGTLFAEFSAPFFTTLANQELMSFSNDTYSNLVELLIYLKARAVVINGGVAVTDLNPGYNLTVNDVHRASFGYKSGDNAAASDGSGALTAGGAVPATITTLRLGNRQNQPLNGHLRRAIYLPKRLANGTHQAISASGVTVLQKPNFADVSLGKVYTMGGRIASVRGDGASLQATVWSYLHLLSTKYPVDVVQPQCRHVLFDSGCTLSAAAFAVAGTVLAGSTVSQVRATLAQASGYFSLGRIVFTSGVNNGQSRSIKLHTSGAPATLDMVVPLFAAPGAGDTFTIYPGCERTQTACGPAKFNNLANFGGEPFVPRPEATL